MYSMHVASRLYGILEAEFGCAELLKVPSEKEKQITVIEQTVLTLKVIGIFSSSHSPASY